MEALRILEKKENLNWEYDEAAAVLYVSIGDPVEALGLDAGEGVGLRIIGVRERTLAAIGGAG